MSLSVSLSAPPLSGGGLSLVGAGHDGDPRSGSDGPVRSSLTRATPKRGSGKHPSKSLVRQFPLGLVNVQRRHTVMAKSTATLTEEVVQHWNFHCMDILFLIFATYLLKVKKFTMAIIPKAKPF